MAEILVSGFKSFTPGVEAAEVSGALVETANHNYAFYMGPVLDNGGDYTEGVIEASGIHDIASRLGDSAEVLLLAETGALALRTMTGEPLSPDQYDAACGVVDAFISGVPLSMNTRPVEVSSSDR